MYIGHSRIMCSMSMYLSSLSTLQTSFQPSWCSTHRAGRSQCRHAGLGPEPCILRIRARVMNGNNEYPGCCDQCRTVRSGSSLSSTWSDKYSSAPSAGRTLKRFAALDLRARIACSSPPDYTSECTSSSTARTLPLKLCPPFVTHTAIVASSLSLYHAIVAHYKANISRSFTRTSHSLLLHSELSGWS